MNYLCAKYIVLFSIFLSFSTAWCMNHEEDLESGFDSPASESSSLIPRLNQAINPTNRKRSAWTNFYTVAGMLFGSGITVAVTWHVANNQQENPAMETNALVYGVGTLIASAGLCCYFTTQGANIFHSTCKKFMKKSEKSHYTSTEESLSIIQ